MEQRRITLGTKKRELGIERKTKGAMADLPKLTAGQFKGTLKDWIRFYSQFMAQINSQNVSKTVKLGYLLQCFKGEYHNLIGNIPNNDWGVSQNSSDYER